jgi:tetratricopeptide (TPR) repeat protein/transcriptional regulator with XRE-family HTH domain
VAEPPVTFAGLLRQLRRQAGLTQEELAGVSESSPRTISDLERGVAATPQRDTVRRLADALSLSGPVRVLFEAAARGRPVSAAGGLAGPVVAGDIPLAPPAFQPREDLVAELRAAGPGVSVVRPVTGMRGVGKTQLAAAYARQCQAAGWRLIAWVNAEDLPGVLGGLAVVADRLGIDRSGKAPEALGGEVRNRLEADGDRCLIVFDNVTDFDVVRPYVPALGSPQVVLTSTEATVAEAGRPVRVGVFSADEALAFLAERTGRDDPDGASALAAELGCLPLALAQAAAVIAAQHLTYHGYLARLRAHRTQKYLPPARGDPYPRGAAEAILLSVEAVAAADVTGLSRDVLDVLSLLSPEGVSRWILYQAELASVWPAEEEAVDEALARLADASLLTFTSDDSVLVHRMVMRVIREQALFSDSLPPLAVKATHLLEACTKSLGEFAGLWEHRTAARECVRQVTALAGQLAALSGEESSTALLALRLWTLESVFALSDSPAQAIEIGAKLVPDCARVLGESHPDALTARGDLALAYWAVGRLDEAVPMFQAVLADCERVLGMSHPDTLATQNNLALAYQDVDRLDDAIPLFETVMAGCERVMGASHPNTLASRNNLARAYRHSGRLDDAVPLFEVVLADQERVLGESHPNTLKSRDNLARAYRDAGRLGEAVPLFEAVLADFERVLGVSHLDTLKSRSNLASSYVAVGRFDEAVPQFEQALAGLEATLGRDHPASVEARTGLANAHRQGGS